MPIQSSITQIRLDNIRTCLNTAVTTLDLVSTNLKTPFLESIVNTMWSLLRAVEVIAYCLCSCSFTNSPQTVKKNKDVCAELLEQIHKLLYAIIQLHMTSNTGGELSPTMLNNLGNFTEYF
jgi:hypothetical protein